MLAKETIKNSEICDNKIPKSEIETRSRNVNSKMVATIGRHCKGAGKQGIFPGHQGTTRNET